MVSERNADKPSYEEYSRWYYEKFLTDLEDGAAERWHEQVTYAGARRLEESPFWQQLQKSLPEWDATFRAEHENYPLLELAQQPQRIGTKSFESALTKAFRWNVLENGRWPRPPRRSPSTASDVAEDVLDDPGLWYGPHNWLADFPDVFRVRLITTYFDGVRYLSEKVRELAHQTTSTPPKLQPRASLDGYHASHIWVYHDLNTFAYDTRDDVTVQVRLEIQVTTFMQASIINMLHRVYEGWRLTGPPRDWQWDHENPAFSVNYLGNTLHYLEGMIVLARDKEDLTND